MKKKIKLSAEALRFFVEAGRKGGGAGTGDSKRRIGAANGRYKGKKKAACCSGNS